MPEITTCSNCGDVVFDSSDERRYKPYSTIEGSIVCNECKANADADVAHDEERQKIIDAIKSEYHSRLENLINYINDESTNISRQQELNMLKMVGMSESELRQFSKETPSTFEQYDESTMLSRADNRAVDLDDQGFEGQWGYYGSVNAKFLRWADTL